MSISSVEAAIRNARTVVTEWTEAGFTYWLEEHTRYAVIDPVITALGWNTSDPKECHPEYWRFRGDESAGRADYALFGTPDLDSIGNGTVEPDVIIEAKGLNIVLEEHVHQLQRYVDASPRMRRGVGVLTNGREWWLYDLERGGSFSGKRMDPVNVLEGNLREAARTLSEWLDRASSADSRTGSRGTASSGVSSGRPQFGQINWL